MYYVIISICSTISFKLFTVKEIYIIITYLYQESIFFYIRMKNYLNVFLLR